MTLREIAEKHSRSIHYNMFSHDEVAFLLNAVVEERAEKLWCIENPYPQYHWNEEPEKQVFYSKALRELNLEGLCLVKEE